MMVPVLQVPLDGRGVPTGDLTDHPNIGQIDISVAIPAYEGARTIADCLESVERATAGRRREIIVVESSGDGTSEYRRTMLNDIAIDGELFDEDFFAFFEGVDVDWRAQHRGWKAGTLRRPSDTT